MKLRNFLNQLTQRSIILTGAMVMGGVSWTLVLTILITGLVLSGERPNLTQRQSSQGVPPIETEAPIPTLEPAATPVLIGPQADCT
jgi:hypothetical protein